MLSRINSSAANCGHSSGDAAGIPLRAIVCAGTRRVGIASRRLLAMPTQTTRPNQCPAISETLEIFDDGEFVGRWKRRAIFVAGVAVARDRDVVLKEQTPFFIRHVRDKAHSLTVEHVVSAIEDLWPLRGCIEQIDE